MAHGPPRATAPWMSYRDPRRSALSKRPPSGPPLLGRRGGCGRLRTQTGRSATSISSSVMGQYNCQAWSPHGNLHRTQQVDLQGPQARAPPHLLPEPRRHPAPSTRERGAGRAKTKKRLQTGRGAASKSSCLMCRRSLAFQRRAAHCSDNHPSGTTSSRPALPPPRTSEAPRPVYQGEGGGEGQDEEARTDGAGAASKSACLMCRRSLPVQRHAAHSGPPLLGRRGGCGRLADADGAERHTKVRMPDVSPTNPERRSSGSRQDRCAGIWSARHLIEQPIDGYWVSVTSAPVRTASMAARRSSPVTGVSVLGRLSSRRPR